ncbi:MAG: hypothetical protein ABSA48_10105 [Terracidiphilus sp.]|jgi:hypothetical protein
MNRLLLSRILLLMLLVSAAVFGAYAVYQNGGASPLAASGAYAVTFHVSTPTTVPDGATIACNARIAPNLSVFEHLTRQVAPAKSSTGFARVANSSANCTVATPFAFNVANSRAGAALSYEIDAYTSAGPLFVRTQKGIPVAYPQTGATANLPLDVNL